MENRIKELKRELIELKTAQKYSSMSTIGYYTARLNTGTHVITYGDGDYAPLTFIYVNGLTLFNISNATTPENNTQYFELSVTRDVQIISTRKILSVT